MILKKNIYPVINLLGFPSGSEVKNMLTMQKTQEMWI